MSKKRSGVFLGLFIKPSLKIRLRQLASASRQTLTQFVTKILEDAIKEKDNDNRNSSDNSR